MACNMSTGTWVFTHKTIVKSWGQWVAFSCSFKCWRTRHWYIPEAHWPTIQAEFMNFRFSERPCIKKDKSGEQLRKDNLMLPTCMHTTWCLPYAHVHTFTLTSTHATPSYIYTYYTLHTLPTHMYMTHTTQINTCTYMYTVISHICHIPCVH